VTVAAEATFRVAAVEAAAVAAKKLRLFTVPSISVFKNLMNADRDPELLATLSQRAV
jgi:hypothetical protein